MEFYDEDGNVVSLDTIMSHPKVAELKKETETQRSLIEQKTKSIADLKNANSGFDAKEAELTKKEQELNAKATELETKTFDFSVTSKITGDPEYVTAVKEKLVKLGAKVGDADFEKSLEYAKGMVQTDGILPTKEAKPDPVVPPAMGGGQPPKYVPENVDLNNYKTTDEDKASYKNLKEAGLIN